MELINTLVKETTEKQTNEMMEKIEFTPKATVKPEYVVGAYQGIGRQGLEFWSAISELIDNTLTVDKNTKCRVVVDKKNKIITIMDDSIGIKGDDLEAGRMMSIGRKVNPGRQLLSKSGVGMKAALYFLGNHFDVITKPESEDVIYKLTPNFNTLNDPGDKIADFDFSASDNKTNQSGTKIIIRDLNTFLKTQQTEDVVVQMLRATYADYLESGKLHLDLTFIPAGKTGSPYSYNCTPLRPLLSNDLNILDSKLRVGVNEPRVSGTLKSDPEDTHLDWEIDVKGGWKLHPEQAWKYYTGKNQTALVFDNYSIRGGTKTNSPYAWSSETSGVNFKTVGIGGVDMGGKILQFNKLAASSRKEGLWVEVTLKKGITPTMMKNDMKRDDNYKDMEAKLIEWLKVNELKSRVKAGYLHLGELGEVRDKFAYHIYRDGLLRSEWGVSLDTFDQQVIKENQLTGGRVDIGIYGDKKTVAVECKKEQIDGQAVSQGVGYALCMGADLLVLVAQDITASGDHMIALWQKKLGIDIQFFNIGDLYTKPKK
jgi:hypothetical protein